MAWNEPGKRDPWKGRQESPDINDLLRRGREGSGTFTDVARGDGTTATLDYVVLPLIEDDRVLGAALAFTELGPG